MQIPDIFSCILTKKKFAQSIYNLPDPNIITNSALNIRNEKKHIVSNFRRLYFRNTCPIAVTSRCCSMKYRYDLVLLQRNMSRCLFIVLGNTKSNEMKYARKSIYHVFLVWMEKSITRA